MSSPASVFRKHTLAVVKARKHLEYCEERRNAETTVAAKAVIQASGLSLRKAATQAGVSAPYLSDIFRGNRKWGVDVLEKFERAFPPKTKGGNFRKGER